MVKITILHSELDRFVEKSSGFSLLIEVDDKQILFDSSFSNDIIINSGKSKFDLKNLDYIILSHGHWDHTNGLEYLRDIGAKIVAHPNCFEKKYEEGKDIGSSMSIEEIKKNFKTELSKEPLKITKNLIFLGEIPRITEFEGKSAIGKRGDGSDDFVLDDSAIVIDSNKGLIIISGCSHAGICNIIEYAKKVMNETKILAVLGGLHLFNKEQTDNTVAYLEKQNINQIYPAHCLDDYAFSEFEKIGAKRITTLQQLNL